MPRRSEPLHPVLSDHARDAPAESSSGFAVCGDACDTSLGRDDRRRGRRRTANRPNRGDRLGHRVLDGDRLVENHRIQCTARFPCTVGFGDRRTDGVENPGSAAGERILAGGAR